MKVDDFTKFHINDPMLKGHSGAITDFEFNPFIDNVLATASEDGTAAIWTIPLEGLTEDLKTPNATLFGHSKKLTHLRFNPSAENVMATASFDQDIRIWDAYQAKEVSITSGLIGQPTCLEWNYDGSLLAVMDKKKRLHVVDPRDQKGALMADPAHDGPKQLKCCWLDSSNRILTTGMSKQMFKEIAIWDCRDLQNPVINKKADKNIEVSDPFYDPINKLVYCAVKGEARVNIWEIVDDDEGIYPVAMYKGEGSHRGFNFFPKRFVDCTSTELMRCLRLTDKFCEYVTFRLPKKAGAFVPGLYGDCPNGSFSKTLDQWVSGESAPPPAVPISPDLAASIKLRLHDGSVPASNNEEKKTTETEVVTVAASSSSSVMHAPVSSGGSMNAQAPIKEIEEMKQSFERKITELEDQLKEKESAIATEPETDFSDQVSKLIEENDQLKDKLQEFEDRVSELELLTAEKDSEIERLQKVRDEQLISKNAE
jgi:coronin-1B/1C/6